MQLPTAKSQRGERRRLSLTGTLVDSLNMMLPALLLVAFVAWWI
jgi:hypothetical protein